MVINSMRSGRVPLRCSIDCKNRLLEPAFRLVSQTHHAQIRATLHDRLDILLVYIQNCVTQVILLDMRDRNGGRTLESAQLDDVIAAFSEILANLIVTN